MRIAGYWPMRKLEVGLHYKPKGEANGACGKCGKKDRQMVSKGEGEILPAQKKNQQK